jgi:hypothetical protein
MASADAILSSQVAGECLKINKVSQSLLLTQINKDSSRIYIHIFLILHMLLLLLFLLD